MIIKTITTITVIIKYHDNIIIMIIIMIIIIIIITVACYYYFNNHKFRLLYWTDVFFCLFYILYVGGVYWHPLKDFICPK